MMRTCTFTDFELNSISVTGDGVFINWLGPRKRY